MKRYFTYFIKIWFEYGMTNLGLKFQVLTHEITKFIKMYNNNTTVLYLKYFTGIQTFYVFLNNFRGYFIK